jgi:hypothetical protein
MIECVLKQTGERTFQCQTEGCGRIITSNWTGPVEQMHYRCKIGGGMPVAATRPLPKMTEEQTKELDEGAKVLGLRAADVMHWGQAIFRWNKAGRPVRTQEEVDAIVAICQSNECGKYLAEWGGRCKLCGCRVNSGTIPLTNKAKMATEHCTYKEPRW